MQDAKTRATQKLYDEHRSISAILSGLRELARAAGDPQVRPEFPVLAAMIRYIDAFPERSHHPKEEQFFFQPLERLAPDAARPILATLRAQHHDGEKLVRELERSLLGLEVAAGTAQAEAFRAAVDRYADFHWNHMRMEEREMLPLAERAFGEEDWRRAAEAFEGNADPIAESRDDFARLFARIVNLAPAPVGLGEPWKRVRA